jgi:hypothetical protein
VFNIPTFSHVMQIHWLPVEAHIHYNTMALAYGAARGTVLPYFQAMLKPYTSSFLPLPPRSALSKLLSVLAPQWWNQLAPGAPPK